MTTSSGDTFQDRAFLRRYGRPLAAVVALATLATGWLVMQGGSAEAIVRTAYVCDVTLSNTMPQHGDYGYINIGLSKTEDCGTFGGRLAIVSSGQTAFRDTSGDMSEAQLLAVYEQLVEAMVRHGAISYTTLSNDLTGLRTVTFLR